MPIDLLSEEERQPIDLLEGFEQEKSDYQPIDLLTAEIPEQAPPPPPPPAEEDPVTQDRAWYEGQGGPEAVGFKPSQSSAISTPEEGDLTGIKTFLTEGPPRPSRTTMKMPGEEPTIGETFGIAARRVIPNLVRGAAQSSELAGGILKYAANRFKDLENLQRWGMNKLGLDFAEGETAGEEAQRFAGESEQISANIAKKAMDTLDSAGYKIPKSIQKRVMDNPEVLKDPRWWIVNLGDTATSMVPPLVTGMIFGPEAGGLQGGLMEGGNALEEMKKAGVPHDRAVEAATAYGLVSSFLNKIGIEEELADRAGMSFLKKMVGHGKAGWTEAYTEGLENPYQAVFEGIAKGEKLPQLWTDFMESVKSMPDVMIPSFVTGGAGGAVTDVARETISRVRENKQNKIDEEILGRIFTRISEEREKAEGGGESASKVEKAGEILPGVTEPGIQEEGGERLPTTESMPGVPRQETTETETVKQQELKPGQRIDLVTGKAEEETAKEPEPEQGTKEIPAASDDEIWANLSKDEREKIVRASGLTRKSGDVSKRGETIIGKEWSDLTPKTKQLLRGNLEAARAKPMPGKTVQDETPIEMKGPGEQDLENLVLDQIEQDMTESEGRAVAAGGTDQAKNLPSTFPDYFKNKGYRSADVLAAINKMRKGEELTDKQGSMMEDLIQGKKREVEQQLGAPATFLDTHTMDEAEQIAAYIDENNIEDVSKIQGLWENGIPEGTEAASAQEQTQPETEEELFDFFDEKKKEAKRNVASNANEGTFADIEANSPEDDTDVNGHQSEIKSVIQMPEILEMARALGKGSLPKIRRLLGRNAGITGLFFPHAGGSISLKAEIFKDSAQAAKTLAHEIGHWVSYVAETIKGSNILGKIAALKDYTKHTLPHKPGAAEALTKEDRDRIWKEARKAEKTIDKEASNLGLTPEQVLAIWNSVEGAGTLSKEIMDFIKSKSGAWKKSIIKEAMKGVVNEELQSFAKSLAGEEKGRTVTPEEAKARYRKLIEEEIKKRQLWEYETMLKEAKEFTHKWKPFDKNRDSKYTSYRYKQEELFADLFSALITNPSYLKKEAPMFWEAFHNYVGERGEVSEIYNRLLADMSRESLDLTKNRMEAFFDMRERAAKVTKEHYEKLSKREEEEIFDTFLRLMVDVNHKTIKVLDQIAKLGETAAAQSKEVVNLIESTHYLSSMSDIYINDALGIVTLLNEEGISLAELDLLLYQKRIVGEGGRSDKANPMGWTKETVTEDIKNLQDMWGDEKFARVVDAAQQFRRMREEHIIPKLTKSGILTPKLADVIHSYTDYVTFDVVKHYNDENLFEGVGDIIKKSLGTFEDIQSPFIATVIKDVAMIKAAHVNEGKVRLVELFKKFDEKGTLISPAEMTGKGKFKKPIKKRNLGIITLLDNGKPKHFYVDKDIASSFEYQPVKMTKLMRYWNTYAAMPMKNILVRFAPIWMLRNAIFRDPLATLKNVEELRFRDFFKYWSRWGRGLKDAYNVEFRGKQSEAYRDVMKMMAIPADRAWTAQDIDYVTELEKMTEDFKASAVSNAKAEKNSKFAAPFRWAADRLGKMGRVSELTSKLAGYYFLKDYTNLSDVEIALKVRNKVGTPNSKRVGSLHTLTNNLFLFSNIGKEGIRTGYRSLKENPRNYIFKTVMLNIVPHALEAMFAGGIMLKLMKGMGADDDDETMKVAAWLTQAFQSISKYDRDHYWCIPYAYDKKEGVSYLRIPQDYEGQIFGTIVSRGIRKEFLGLTGVTSAIYSQQPWQLNPILAGAMDLTKYYLMGQNPVDNYYGKSVLTDQEYSAGGKYAAVALASHLADSTNVGVFGYALRSMYGLSRNLDELERSTVENAIRKTPLDVFRAFSRTTDRGLYEESMDVIRAERKAKAKISIEYKNAINKVAAGKTKDEFTSAELKAIGLRMGTRPSDVRNSLRKALMRKGNYLSRAMSNASRDERITLLFREMRRAQALGKNYKGPLQGGNK